MNRTGDQLFAGAGLSTDEHRRVSRRHSSNLLEYFPHRIRPPDDVLEHRRTANLIAENEILVLGTVFGAPAVVDVGTGGVPLHDSTMFVVNRLVANEAPSMLSGMMPRPNFQFERHPIREPPLTLLVQTLQILTEEESMPKALFGQIVFAQSAVLEERPVRVEDPPLGAQR